MQDLKKKKKGGERRGEGRGEGEGEGKDGGEEGREISSTLVEGGREKQLGYK